MRIDDAISGRFTCRRFLPDQVPRETIEQLLSLARHAPSGSNIQPWQAWVVGGDRLDDIKAKMVKAANDPTVDLTRTYQYYPKTWQDPWLQRRRELGWKLYGMLGIARGDRERSKRQALRNYTLFDAPVGVFITLDETLEIGSFLDIGMFAQTFMLAAQEHGYATAPQVSVAAAHEVLRRELDLPHSHHVVMAISLGIPDMAAPENQLATERLDVKDFANFIGFARQG